MSHDIPAQVWKDKADTAERQANIFHAAADYTNGLTADPLDPWHHALLRRLADLDEARADVFSEYAYFCRQAYDNAVLAEIAKNEAVQS